MSEFLPDDMEDWYKEHRQEEYERMKDVKIDASYRYKTESGEYEESKDFHTSGCYPSCDGTYRYGGDYGSAQPFEKPCWCGCHKK